MSTFLEPDISFSDDEEVSNLSARKISNKFKKTQTNKDAIKHPNTFFVEDDEDPEDDPLIISEEDEEENPSRSQASSRKRKSSKWSSNNSKKSRRDDSDEEFIPDDDNDSEDNDDIESVASEDMSDENISDSDFDPELEDDECEDGTSDYFKSQNEETNDTINLSSDNESPEKETTRVIHSDSKEFWSKVQELRTKGFSIQQSGGVGKSSK